MSLRDWFLAVVDEPDAVVRASKLAAMGRGDDAARAEIEAMVAAGRRPLPLLDQQPARPLTELSAAAGAALDGEFVPDFGKRYRVLKKLGEGGMGLVFAAEQLEPVRRKVALKILRPGLVSPPALARFEAEREALALLDGPGIARIHDSGVTREGLPYFAMDWIDGEPLTAYCAKRNLPLPARVALLADVCDIVHAAHRKGLIHRDLKPSNVLVGERDGRPAPVVIDFGIAKALASAGWSTPPTESGRVYGTLEYLSPEQAAGDSRAIDARTDVHALGALAYETLAGVTPIAADRLRALPYAEALAALRSEDAAPLSRHAAGGGVELDWIVAKALEKEPGRRYDSAAALAADLRRLLAGDAVEAGPPSALYRVRKLLRRHWRTSLAAAALLLSLVAGLIGTGYGLWQARKQAVRAASAEIRAKEKADEAELRAKREENLTTFFRDRFLAAANPKLLRNGLGPNVKLLEAIIASENQIAVHFKDDPGGESRIRRELSSTYRLNGKHEDALKQGKKAVALAITGFGIDHVQVAYSRTTLHNVLGDAGDREGALREIDLARRIFRREHGPDGRLTLDADRRYASSLPPAARTEAIAVLDEVRRGALRSTDAIAKATLIHCVSTLAELRMAAGEFKEANETLAEALRNPVPNGISPSVAWGLRLARAKALRGLGSFAAALQLANEQIKDIPAEQHQAGFYPYASAVADAGNAALALGQYGEAAAGLEHFSALPPPPGKLADNLTAFMVEMRANLALALAAQGVLDRCVASARRAQADARQRGQSADALLLVAHAEAVLGAVLAAVPATAAEGEKLLRSALAEIDQLEKKSPPAANAIDLKRSRALALDALCRLPCGAGEGADAKDLRRQRDAQPKEDHVWPLPKAAATP